MFWNKNATCIDKMNVINSVVITEKNVKLNVQYSNIEINIKDVPKLLADVTNIYAVCKPLLDEISQKEYEEKLKESENESVEPLDLSEIPF